jgi:hypothetical protein
MGAVLPVAPLAVHGPATAIGMTMTDGSDDGITRPG